MVGCDVVGLYPNLDPINVARISADAVRHSKVKFKGVDYCMLAIYLVLILGEHTMAKLGLQECIPKRKYADGKKTGNPRSLSNSLNRDTTNWDCSGLNLTDRNKTEMLANLIQLMVLLMTGTTCYRFGGHIYKQKGGLGIGLRGSAAIANLAMGRWDVLWAERMK